MSEKEVDAVSQTVAAKEEEVEKNDTAPAPVDTAKEGDDAKTPPVAIATGIAIAPEVVAGAVGPSWTETDENALLLFVENEKKDKDTDTDLLDDEHAGTWDDIATRFPEKNAINCLQRYAKMKLRDMQNMYLGTVTPGDIVTAAATTATATTTTTASEGQKRPAEEGASPDAKRAKITDESLGQWTDEETEMLKEMVTQYPNSKLMKLFISTVYSTVLYYTTLYCNNPIPCFVS